MCDGLFTLLCTVALVTATVFMSSNMTPQLHNPLSVADPPLRHLRRLVNNYLSISEEPDCDCRGCHGRVYAVSRRQTDGTAGRASSIYIHYSAGVVTDQ